MPTNPPRKRKPKRERKPSRNTPRRLRSIHAVRGNYTPPARRPQPSDDEPPDARSDDDERQPHAD